MFLIYVGIKRGVKGDSPFDVIRNRGGVLASIRRGEYLFKQKPVEYEVELDI